jgi:hypothetical protein
MRTPKVTVPPAPDDPAEYQRFLDMAREVEADEDPEAINRAFRRVIKPPKTGPTKRAAPKAHN